MKLSLALPALFILGRLDTVFSAAVVPSDACIPIASKLLKEGLQYEVQNQVCVRSKFPFIKPSYQTQSFSSGPSAVVFDAGFKGFPKFYKVHAVPNQLTVYDDLNSITLELVKESVFDLSGCYITTAHRGFDFDKVYMAKVDDFIPAIPLLFPDCNVSSIDSKTNQVIPGDSRNVTYVAKLSFYSI
ncbi:hypothetical protein K450DRAFT_292123 [Umbelopsis ramanniana AG]|uniref:Uncharacterized protein n=1 Tax=Umbelopsis ramanniana AG TaxID=1314678 RepID=A0AAD5E1L2_UMBRA|nr:uncharacterized protein K450DRAFT_292123 [Umbelopsis ramanniana AG]KAI8575968.1 hypothetical protein K450DRAFT_292123 [Umbelopsis ramanniana AG]